MSDFRIGDQVKMREGAVSYYGTDVGGLTGEVTMVYAKDMAVLLTGMSGEKIVKFEDATKIKEVHNVKTEDEKIEAALAKTKKDGGYCSDFDRAVERAKNLPLVERLKFVAEDMGETGIFREFEANLKALDAPPVEIPEVGRWIKATTADGETHEFEVQECARGGKPGEKVYLSNNGDVLGNGWCAAIGGLFDSNNVVAWEYIEKPYTPVPEFEEGAYVTVTTADGKTHTGKAGQWSRACENSLQWPFITTYVGGEYLVLCKDAAAFNHYSRPGYESHNVIVSWEPAEKPASEYKVGDVVPARTRLDRDWYGERVDGSDNDLRFSFPAQGFSGHDRKILWIEE